MAYRTPLESRIAKKTTRAILEYGMVEDGDRVMVGLSGGKDSWALLEILHVLRQRAPIRFSIIAVNVDSGYKEYKHDLIRSTCEARGWDLPHRAHGDRRGDGRPARGRRDAVLALRAAPPRRPLPHRGRRSARPRSRSATTPTTSSRRCSSTCSSPAPPRPCRRACSPTTAAMCRAAVRVRQRRRGAALHEGSAGCRSSGAAARRAAISACSVSASSGC